MGKAISKSYLLIDMLVAWMWLDDIIMSSSCHHVGGLDGSCWWLGWVMLVAWMWLDVIILGFMVYSDVFTGKAICKSYLLKDMFVALMWLDVIIMYASCTHVVDFDGLCCGVG